MAVDMAIKFEGGNSAEGESKVKGFEKQIDVLSWSWGASQSGSMHVATGGGAGKANVQDLSFTKWIDKASPKLQFAVMSGVHYDKATLTIRKAGGDDPVPYLVITMEDLIITSFSTGGSGGEDRLTENVSLNFAKVKVEYQTQDDKGKGSKAGDYTWDIASNTK